MMKSSLDHMPPRNQRELAQVLEILHEEFEDALKEGAAGFKKRGRILKIILFGSYAKGGWVDEPFTMKGYRSDFDLLVIVNDRRLCEFADYWYKAADRLIRDKSIETPVSFIVHSRREVNTYLKEGQYFFSDIRKEGIVLYELDDEPLAELQPLAPADRLRVAKDHFEHRFNTASKYLKGSRFYLVGGLRYALIGRAGLFLRPPHAHELRSAFPQHQVPALACRGTGPAAGRGVPARSAPRARLVQHAQRSLCEGAVLEALRDQRGGPLVAGRAGRHIAGTRGTCLQGTP